MSASSGAIFPKLTTGLWSQRALTRYYLEAGAGGIAVGVHTTQFAIRDPQVALLESVLTLAAETVAEVASGRPILKVAGLCGPTEQALAEAELAASLGYDLGLLSMAGLAGWSEEELLERARAGALHPGRRAAPAQF